jgi:hypothetical protein
VTSLPATRVLQRLVLTSGLLCWPVVCPAADGLETVPAAHGPLMMIYLKQPLGARGATRIWGLRLEQAAPTPTQSAVLMGAMPGASTSAIPNQRDIVDLQIRRNSDVRIEFGRRVTWNIGRREFGLTANQPNMALRLPLQPARADVVARSLP